jgi:3'-5' exoribonuclease
MAKQFIGELKENQPVDSTFSVKYKKPPANYKSKQGAWFTAGLSDKTGEIELRFWGRESTDTVQSIYDSFKVSDVIRVKGIAKVSMRDNRLEIHVNEGEGALEKAGSYDREDFIPKTKASVDDMMSELLEVVDDIQNPSLKKLLDAFFRDDSFANEFRNAPAGITMHHAYIGGLLEHTLHVLRICRTFSEIYPKLDKDLLFTGALLHDIGKTKEYEFTTNIKQSEEGMLRGHITIGEEMIMDKIKQMDGFPEDLKIKLAHIMLAHHGNREYGSPVIPAFAEAEAIYFADEADSKIDQHIDTRENPATDDFRVWSRKLGRPVYLK